MCDYFVINNIYTYSVILENNICTGVNFPLFMISILTLYSMIHNYYIKQNMKKNLRHIYNMMDSVRCAFFKEKYNDYDLRDMWIINLEILQIHKTNL